MATDNHLRSTIEKLTAYCCASDWAGYDPYDAVNSKIFAALPFLDSKLPRLVLTQILKRSPINVRRLLLIPKTQNSKAIALFLSAFLKLSRSGVADAQQQIEPMIELLAAQRSKGVPYSCWGYSFPWQTRTIVVPVGAPNLVCTAFVAKGLLDAYEERRDERCLNMAVSAAEYVLNKLFWTAGPSVAGFSYPLPNLRNRVPNASFLGAELLCRVYKHTRDPKFLAPALMVTRSTVAMQRGDGSWNYGESRSQGWIDNFHTGYNLCALQSIGRYADTSEFESHLIRGLGFYRAHFFRNDGAPKYFHDRTYPIDIHSVAQSIITLLTFGDLDSSNVPLAHSVFAWAMRNMWDERGFFYYRVLRSHTNRIPYMRWAQAWMLLATSALLAQSRGAARDSENVDTQLLARAC